MFRKNPRTTQHEGSFTLPWTERVPTKKKLPAPKSTPTWASQMPSGEKSSHETKIELSQSQEVWWTKSEALHGGGSITGVLHKVNEMMKKEDYLKILQSFLKSKASVESGI